MAGKDRIVDMGFSSETENFEEPRSGSTPSGDAHARAKDSAEVSTWSQHHQPPANQEEITLVVEDTRFVMERALFTQHPDTMLGRMFSGEDYVQVNEMGEYEVAAQGYSASTFRAILDFYRTGVINCPPHGSLQELREACDYFLIPSNATTAIINLMVDGLDDVEQNLQDGFEAEKFFSGQVFQDEEGAKVFLKKYNEKHFTELVIRTNNKKAMVVKCKHGVHRKSESKDLRPNQHFNFVGCNAQVNFYKSQVPGAVSLKVTNVNLDHNDHELSEDLYNRTKVKLTEEDEDLVKILVAAKSKPSRIQKVLLSKSNKRIGLKKLKNLVAKITPTENEDDSKVRFEDFLDEVEKDGVFVDWETDADGSIKTLFITSSST